jgi:hypothetical protein
VLDSSTVSSLSFIISPIFVGFFEAMSLTELGFLLIFYKK